VKGVIVFTIFTIAVNYLLKANYNYLVARPDTASLLDHFGPWPWYIVVAYLLMFLLFFVALIPFLIKKRRA